MAVLLGDAPASRELAAEVRENCLHATGARSAPDYWMEATLAEAALILGEVAVAAAQRARGEESRAGATRMSSTPPARRGCSPALAGNPARRADAPRDPAGARVHLPHDRPRRSEGRRAFHFPRPAVRDALRARFDAIAPPRRMARQRCGSDISAGDCGRDGHRKHVVLPFRPRSFRARASNLPAATGRTLRIASFSAGWHRDRAATIAHAAAPQRSITRT